MTTARAIIDDALTFHLNVLATGSTADADTLAVCLRALNNLADEMNGGKSFLFREILTASSTISAASAALGTAWATLSPGDKILGATYAASGQDNPMWSLTMAQYQAIPDKTQTGEPQYFAHDGLATVYFDPAPTGHVITLRTKQVVSDFADIDTDYSMPKGYKSALSAMLSERLAVTMAPSMLQKAAMDARAARQRIYAQAANPAIINAGHGRPNILRGY